MFPFGSKILLSEDSDMVCIFAYHLQAEIRMGWDRDFCMEWIYFVRAVHTSRPSFSVDAIANFPFL